MTPDAVFELWKDFCRGSTGHPDFYTEDGLYKIGPAQPSMRHPGRVVGSIYRVSAMSGSSGIDLTDPSTFLLRRTLGYQVDADGRVLQGPAILRTIAASGGEPPKADRAIEQLRRLLVDIHTITPPPEMIALAEEALQSLKSRRDEDIAMWAARLAYGAIKATGDAP